MAKKTKVSRSASNALNAYRSGIKAGGPVSHRSPDGPCRCDNFVQANPDKYVNGHPPVSETEPHRTENPVAKTITGRVLRSIPRTK